MSAEHIIIGGQLIMIILLLVVAIALFSRLNNIEIRTPEETDEYDGSGDMVDIRSIINRYADD